MESATDSDKTTCHFWDPSSGAGRNPNSKCEGEAKGFVRVKHSGRLCPLCGACQDTFVRAQKDMNDDVKNSIPGHGEFEEVALSPESIEEFRKQAPKKSA
jgi:hypothetical protein